MPPLVYRALALACAISGCNSEHELAEGPATNAPARGIATPRAVAPVDSAADGLSGAGSTSSDEPSDASAGTASTPAEPSCSAGRGIFVGELINARDLGGTALSPSGAVACGSLLRGPPLQLSTQGCEQARELGLRTVVDLRMPSEREARPDAACVTAKRVLAPLPVPYGLSADDYLRDLSQTASIAQAFQAFGDPQAYPIYFHCTVGRDRTGIVGALALLVLGATRATVMQEYLLSRSTVGAYPDALDAVLDEVEKRGGAATFLKAAGVSDDELSVLRAHVIAN